MAKLLLYILVFLTGFALDGWTKHLANTRLVLQQPVQLYKRFYLVLIHNKGAALGFLKHRRRLLRLLSGVAMGLMVGIFVYSYNSGYSQEFMVSLSVVLAGATGNFLERVRKGRVTDFLFFKWKRLPVFNLADLLIVIGVIFVYRYGLF
jgi:signal peptidase II